MVMLPSRILTIPVELFLEILKHLDYKQILLCSSLCKTFRDTISRYLELQYVIELAADGLIDNPHNLLPTSEKLQLLLDRRRRWRTLDWVQVTPVAVPGACQAYELVGGVFSKTMNARNGMEGGSRHLIATWLPTRMDEDESTIRRIVRPDLGISTRDFAIDPTQDLIALVDAEDNHLQLQHSLTVTIKVHLRTISTNVKHPRAARGELTAEIQFLLGSSFIQIVDDVVGLFFWVHGPGLIIWNWVTGEIIVKCVASELPAGTWDFAFLSNRAFMITATAEDGSIELFSFSGHGGRAAPTAVTSSTSTEDNINDPLIISPTHVATLRLPPLVQGQEIHNFSTHSGPFIKGFAAAGDPGRSFEVAPDTRVHLLSIHYGERGLRHHLFVHNKFLLNYIPGGVGSGEREGGVWMRKKIDWSDWGPKNTRLMPHNVQFQWLRYVHGSRVVLPPLWRFRAGTTTTLCVLDFNVHPTRVNDPAGPVTSTDPEQSGVSYGIVTSPTVVDRGRVFQNDVVTSLPYAESRREGTFNYSGFLIDDERIIGMKSKAFVDGNMSDVDVYTF